jgi:hypothetical protein
MLSLKELLFYLPIDIYRGELIHSELIELSGQKQKGMKTT